MYFRYIGKTTSEINYGVILYKEREGIFRMTGKGFCVAKEELVEVPAVNCKALDYKVGDQFTVVDGETEFYAKGSTIELIEDDGSALPWFKYVAGPKPDTVRSKFAAGLQGLVPVKGFCQPVKEDQNPTAKGFDFQKHLFDAVNQIDPQDAYSLPAISVPEEHAEAKPSEWLLRGFDWTNSQQGAGYWNRVHKKLLKAEENYELAFKGLMAAGMVEAANNLPKLFCECLADSKSLQDILFHGFIWKKTPQGHDYWSGVHTTVKEIRNLADRVHCKLQKALAEAGLNEAAEKLPEISASKKSLTGWLEYEPEGILSCAFIWEDTQQGHTYWSTIRKTLNEKKTKPKISMHKQYTNKAGRPVRILCVDSGIKNYPVVGIVTLSDGSKICSEFTETGQVFLYKEDSYADLIEV